MSQNNVSSEEIKRFANKIRAKFKGKNLIEDIYQSTKNRDTQGKEACREREFNDLVRAANELEELAKTKDEQEGNNRNDSR